MTRRNETIEPRVPVETELAKAGQANVRIVRLKFEGDPRKVQRLEVCVYNTDGPISKELDDESEEIRNPHC